MPSGPVEMCVCSSGEKATALGRCLKGTQSHELGKAQEWAETSRGLGRSSAVLYLRSYKNSDSDDRRSRCTETTGPGLGEAKGLAQGVQTAPRSAWLKDCHLPTGHPIQCFCVRPKSSALFYCPPPQQQVW